MAGKALVELGLSTLFSGGKKSFGSAGEEFLSTLSKQDTFNLKQLHKLDFDKGTRRFEDFGESVRQGIDQNIPERANDVHGTLIDIESEFTNQRHLDTQVKQGTDLTTQKGYDPQTELDGLEQKYLQETDQSDWNRILEDGWEQEEAIESALAGIQRAKDRGSARGQDTYTRILRQKQGTPGKYVEEAGKEFAQSRADMSDRLVRRDAYGKPIAEGAAARGEYPQFPGQKPSKKTSSSLKATEGLEAIIEQHHMMSAYDSSVLADQLGKLGKKFKYNAYMYMLNQYKMLPGDFDLNIANIPAGPHRLKGGNLHAWLNDMGFEDFWRDFAKANPGNPDPNKMMQAIDQYFDEVFYPALIKMDALVQQAPKNHKWDGLYIAPYLLKDAKARIKHLNAPYTPEAKFKEGSSAYETALDAKHDLASQQGLDTQTRTWETSPDGLPLMSREGFPKPKKSKKKAKK